MSDTSQGPGWWQASDGKWYPPESAAQPQQPQPQQPQSGPSGPPGGPQFSRPYQGQPQPGYGYPQPSAPPTNPLAIAALICGILWGWGLLSIAAIVLGIIGLSQIRQKNQGGKGLAIAGVVLGAVGVVGAILTTIFIVAVSDEVGEELASRPAIVRVTAPESTCWSGDIGNDTEEGCGGATFEVDTIFADVASVDLEKTTGDRGRLTVEIEVEGESTQDSTTDPFGSVSVTSG